MSDLLQQKLQQFNLGMVWLDAENKVSAFNDIAWQILSVAGEQTLGVSRGALHGIDIVKLHPEKAQDKLRELLKNSESTNCPVKSPPPVTMMINIPDRVLLIKVSKMFDPEGIKGTCMVFYDLTDETTMPQSPIKPGIQNAELRQLKKIPIYRANRLILIDLDDVAWLEASDHYTWITTVEGRYLSNLSLADLETRIEPKVFFRCHRSHIVNLKFVKEIDRVGDNHHLLLEKIQSAIVPVSRKRTADLKSLLGLP
ncbi:heme-containing CO-sensing transcriptional regulator RcoM 1 [mine drainage metagenome]|uniref:Heme-containing CO-sensing transcriptional regulator RcoM 1 n=1 Tax=mine drainage metagenome TaxID=410659 RepID=A0A1J5RS58_9ZZZZ